MDFENKLRKRKKHESDKQFQCEPCNKTFTSKSYFKDHILSFHENLTKFQCEICNKCFNRSDTLHRHYRDVHKRKSK